MNVDDCINDFKILKRDFGEIGSVNVSEDLQRCFICEYKPNLDSFIRRNAPHLIKISFPKTSLVNERHVETDSSQFMFFYGRYVDTNEEDRDFLAWIVHQMNLIGKTEKNKLEKELIEYIKEKI